MREDSELRNEETSDNDPMTGKRYTQIQNSGRWNLTIGKPVPEVAEKLDVRAHPA